MRLYTLIYLLSLLLLLPQAMLGQTSFANNSATQNSRVIKKYETKGWWHLFVHGGTIRTKSSDGKRTGDHYLRVEPGGGLIGMDYVNGFTYGPDLAVGRFFDDYSRLELGAIIKWPGARKELMWDLKARYILPPEWQSSIEVFFSNQTEDFDPDPLMNSGQKQLASSLFGWNSYKLYVADRWGLRSSMLLHDDVMLEGAVWHEGREETSNHRKRNVFRMKGESNDPVMRGYKVGLTDVRNPGLWRSDLSVVLKPGSKLYIYDDMHSQWRTQAPTFRLDAKAGWGKEKCVAQMYEGFWIERDVCGSSELHYLSLDFNVRQRIGESRDKHQFEYFASAGWFPVRNYVQLPDMRHFDASHFCWQNRMESSLTWFSLLTNYELSTSKHWAEVHGEYLRRYNSFFAQYLQLHALSVAEYSMHYEFSYGWHLSKELRIGLSAGWDGSHYDGLGFNLIITNNN